MADEPPPAYNIAQDPVYTALIFQQWDDFSQRDNHDRNILRPENRCALVIFLLALVALAAWFYYMTTVAPRPPY